MHYKRWKRWGDPNKRREPNTIEGVLSRYTVDENGCWNAPPLGRAKTTLNNRTVGLCRLSYEQHKGPLPHGRFVCHDCDNPRCFNPSHLYAGTQKDNVRDMDERGRRSKWNRSLTDAQVRYIRAALAAGRTQVSLAAELGTTQPLISMIKLGRTYRDIV